MGAVAKSSFATIRAGLISTGIGAFLVAIGALVGFFTNTKRGADAFNVALTGIGATFDVLKDRISTFGEGLTFIFSGEFQKGAEMLKNSFKGIADEIANESKAMMDLKRRTNELRDADNQFMIQKAETRKEIEKARLIAEDETKSAEERLINLEKALDLEAKTTEQELELAKERMKIKEEEMALSENSAEDERELAQLKADVIMIETASLKMRRRVVTEVNALQREISAELKARVKEETDEMTKQIGELQKLPKVGQQVNNKLIKADNQYFENLKKNTDARIALRQYERDVMLGIAGQFAGALGRLANDNKALAVSEAIINTYVAVQQTMADRTIPSTLVKLGLSATVLANGLANVRNILKTDVPGGGGLSANIPSTQIETPAPQMLSGAFTLGGAPELEPTRAYVVSDDITNSQNKLANIRRRATI